MADSRGESVRVFVRNRRQLGYSLCNILGLPMADRYLILGVVSGLRDNHGPSFSNEEIAETLVTVFELGESKREETVQALNESDSQLAELGLSTIVSLDRSSLWMAITIALEFRRDNASEGEGVDS